MGCSPWGRSESDTTERLHFDFSLSCIGGGNGNPLQCPCLEKPRDGGAWWAAVCGVAQSRARLTRLSSSSRSCFLTLGVYLTTPSGRQGRPDCIFVQRLTVRVLRFRSRSFLKCVLVYGLGNIPVSFWLSLFQAPPTLSPVTPVTCLDSQQPRRRAPCSSTASAALGVCRGFDHDHSQLCEAIPRWNLICLSLIIPGAEHFSWI